MTYTPRQSLSIKIAKQIFAAQHPFGVKRTQGERNEDAHFIEQQAYHENIMKYIDEYVDEQKRLYAESVINTETTAVYSKADTPEKQASQVMANVKAQQRARIK